MIRMLPVVLLVAACGQSPVSVRGTVTDDITSKSLPLVGATVSIRNGMGGPVDEATTNGRGRFNLQVPAGQRIYAIVEADDHVPTSFTGGSGFDPVLRVPDGTLFAVPETSLATRLDPFAGCPGLESGGVVIGEVRVNNLTDDETGENPLVQPAIVEWLPDGDSTAPIEACYLDEEGVAYGPDATLTGPSALYAIPAVPAGLGILSVRYSLVEGGPQTSVSYDAYMPEDGVIARFPTWVEFETPIQ